MKIVLTVTSAIGIEGRSSGLSNFLEVVQQITIPAWADELVRVELCSDS